MKKMSKKEKQKHLQQIYLNSNKRTGEKIVLVTFAALWGTCFFQYIIAKSDSLSSLAYSGLFFIIGMLLADMFSGFVHWGFDTWGTIETPVFGQFIRSFREHHLDSVEMCNHDFIEANADSVILTIPVLAYLIYSEPTSTTGWGVYSVLIWTAILVCFTNEIHKWSHSREVNAIVRLLQNCHLILPPRHHHIHHIAPHETYYCITNGWMNPILEIIDFWQRIEVVITKFTGAIPRVDDFSWCEITLPPTHK